MLYGKKSTGQLDENFNHRVTVKSIFTKDLNRDRKNRDFVSQKAWHDKDPILLNGFRHPDSKSHIVAYSPTKVMSLLHSSERFSSGKI